MKVCCCVLCCHCHSPLTPPSLFPGYNTSVFGAALPRTSGRVQREETNEGQAAALAKTGKTASAGAIWYSTGGDCLNATTVLRARQIQRESMQAARAQKEAEQQSAAEKLEEAASTAYDKFVKKGEDKLTVPDLKALVKFIMALEEHEGDKISLLTTRTLLLERLEDCDQLWTSYFVSPGSDGEEEEEEEEAEESGSDEDSSSESESESESEYED